MIDAIGVIVPLTSIRYQECMAPDSARGFLRSRISNLGFKSKITREGDIYIHGSLPKLLNGSNVASLSQDRLIDALSRIEDELSVDLEKCKLVSVEVAASLAVEHSPNQYLMEWGMMSRMSRNAFNSNQTVYFKNKTWEIRGYDKGAEVGDGNLPEEFQPECLRIEYKRSKRLSKLVGKPISPWGLLDSGIYLRLVEIWMLKYFGIWKLFYPSFKCFPKTSRELRTALSIAGARTLSLDSLIPAIKAEEKAGRIDRREASRMRKLLNELCTASLVNNPDMFSPEIDRKVLQTAQAEAVTIWNWTTEMFASADETRRTREMGKITPIVDRILGYCPPSVAKESAA